jgi:alpha-D-ribose 1-methylphosphonate 5-triphosphate synthase subunit PhnH
MNAVADSYSGGFPEAVRDAQAVFRSLMDALARPGTAHSIATLTAPPRPLPGVPASVALTICDHDTPVWLSESLRRDAILGWLRFHTGCPVTPRGDDAQFAFFAVADELTGFGAFSPGTDEYPDRSTTLVVPVASLSGGDPLVLTGPGIETKVSIAPEGLPAGFVEMWRANAELFPRGVDVILAGPDALMGLPRTTRVAIAEVD